ncbi:MAG: AAA family ATPase [Clostridia bacterium]|nr:AAA family ATPase [Clostridia bacterium]
MIIEKIHIDCFGNLEECTLELSDGVNIIEGANESGKSTLAAFIKFIFYGLGTKSRDLGPSERDRYINWHTGNAGGHIVIKTSEARFRIERTIIIAGQRIDNGEARKNYREGLQVIDLSNNSPVAGISSPGEYFFGVDEEVFSRTAFISQLDGARIDGGKLTQSIENILFSASENINIAKAVKKLDSSRVTLLHKNGAGGQIHELEIKCTQLESKLESAKQTSADILEKESSLRAAKEKYTEETSRAERLKKEIKSFENAAVAALFDKMHSFQEKLCAAQTACDELIKKYTLNDLFPDESFLSELEAASEKYELSLKASDTARSELEKAKLGAIGNTGDKDSELSSIMQKHEKARNDLEAFKRRVHFATVMSAIFASIALLFILGGTASVHLTFFADIGKLLIFSSILPIMLAFVFFGIRAGTLTAKRKFLKNHGAADEETFDRLLRADEENARVIKEKSDTLTRLESEYKDTLERTENALQELEQKNAWKFSDNVKENIKAARLARSELSNAQSECEKIAATLEVLKTQLQPYNEDEVRQSTEADVDISGIDASNISAKRRECDFISSAAKALETRIHNLEKELASLYPQSDNPARIAEKIELAHTFIAEYRKKHAAYLLAIEKIEEASLSMRDNISPKLADFTSRLMSDITHGKYTEIGIDSDFKVNVRTDAGTRDIGYLSAGTQDITYVSLRLALINSLFRKQTPPVIFDESFSRLDDTRLSQMLKLINLTGTGMQSILLTSSSRDARLMSMAGEYGYIKLEQ